MKNAPLPNEWLRDVVCNASAGCSTGYLHQLVLGSLFNQHASFPTSPHLIDSGIHSAAYLLHLVSGTKTQQGELSAQDRDGLRQQILVSFGREVQPPLLPQISKFPLHLVLAPLPHLSHPATQDLDSPSDPVVTVLKDSSDSENEAIFTSPPNFVLPASDCSEKELLEFLWSAYRGDGSGQLLINRSTRINLSERHVQNLLTDTRLIDEPLNAWILLLNSRTNKETYIVNTFFFPKMEKESNQLHRWFISRLHSTHTVSMVPLVHTIPEADVDIIPRLQY